jgi:hypothetical protein
MSARGRDRFAVYSLGQIRRLPARHRFAVLPRYPGIVAPGGFSVFNVPPDRELSRRFVGSSKSLDGLVESGEASWARIGAVGMQSFQRALDSLEEFS